ncbi:hypothetical protein CPTAKMNP4_200 [Salmonella phage vB_SenM-AKM_NP4]|nr:hypothetical protein STP4a_196 [Salmonella phage STP4-a]UFK27062.1 hypothetical protein LG358_00041 [Escherichia phage UoN_LG358_1]WDR21861.1 hypothetical protein PJM34_0193 [Salmonella phage vB_SenM_UTK0003]WKV23548.1 hypothetical protein SEA1_gp0200 [Salmonella phage SEA1]WLI71822.1 hypothetical protein CPTAKMNP4_200 [Salmonella phage vB_SenM-AKM_NP4]AHJ86793.1 hypothetical protein STP4a_196 [Salmonella phage STP4-a]
MIVSVAKSVAAKFERMINCPMIDVIEVRVRNHSVEYEIDAPDFFEIPSWVVVL